MIGISNMITTQSTSRILLGNDYGYSPKSLDLNPTEHLGDELERRIHKKKTIRNIQELKNCSLQDWNPITGETTKRLVFLMNNRLKAIVNP